MMVADWLDGCHFLDACHWTSLKVMTVEFDYMAWLFFDHCIYIYILYDKIKH